MSTTIVKALSTVKKEDGLWHVRGCGASSNLYPRTYSHWDGEEGYETREELEGILVREFYRGNVRGTCRYARFVNEHVAGVANCHAWDRFVKLEAMCERAFNKTLKHINEPKDSVEKMRWLKVEARIRRWIRDMEKPLGVELRRWKPNTERCVVRINGSGYVTSAGEFRCKYVYCGSVLPRNVKVFTKAAAIDFCRRFENLNPVIEKVSDGKGGK